MHFGKKILGLPRGRDCGGGKGVEIQLGDDARNNQPGKTWGPEIPWDIFSRVFNILFKSQIFKNETMVYTLKK